MEANQNTYIRFYRQVFNALAKKMPNADSVVERKNTKQNKKVGITRVSNALVSEHYRYHAALPKSFGTTSKKKQSANIKNDKAIKSLKDLDKETISLVEHQYGAFIDEKYRERFLQVCSEIENFDSNQMKNLVKEVVFDLYNTIIKGQL